MAKSITLLNPITSPVRANYDLAIESTTDPLEETKRFNLGSVSGKNVRIVNSMSDFDDAASGVRPTVANTTYVICNNDLTTSDRFTIASGVEFRGFGEGASSLTYTGSGNLFTVTDFDFEIRQFKIDLSNTGTLLSASSTSGFNFTVIADMMVFNALKLGTTTRNSLSITNTNIQSFADGWSFVGAFVFFNNFEVGYLDNTASSTTLDLGTATINNFIMRDTAMRGSGTGISGATASANIDANAIADMDTTEMTIATPLSGVARTDFRWSFRNCRGILDTHRIGEAALTSTETVTISSTGVYVQVAGSSWSDEVSESFTITSAGVMTYIGEIDRRFKITVAATISKVGGGADQICARIGIDTGSGFVTTAASMSCTENASPTTVFSQRTAVLSNGDDVAVFVANEDSTSNIDVTVSSFIITEVS